MTLLRTAPEPTGRRLVVVLAAVGVVAGVAAKAADESGVGGAADLGTFPAVWVLGFGYEPDLIATWLVLSATAVAAVASVSWWATRRPGPWAGALLALVGGTAPAGGAVRDLYLWWSGAGLLLHEVQAGVEVAVALTVTLALPRHASTRLWGVLLVVPMWWLAAELLDRLYGVGAIR